MIKGYIRLVAAVLLVGATRLVLLEYVFVALISLLFFAGAQAITNVGSAVVTKKVAKTRDERTSTNVKGVGARAQKFMEF